ncbi:cyclin-D4-1-like [Canna indica]|uniref:Cyclin-D4-1-like n=1 Tax=Canna indica TaxID=4628 RepID=A0AAQ3JWE3_9LILI|nr:cyclin-D4-1-like [Canna indica]
MGVRCKYASSILLCSEDCSSILGLGEEEEEQEFRGEVQKPDLCQSPRERSDFYGRILMDFTVQSDDCFASLIEKEAQNLPRGDYAERLLRGQLDVSLRSDAIDWMRKVHSHYNFGPLTVYLSVNYLDRFLSSYEISHGKAWMIQLLSVACLSLAAKVEETIAYLPMDLQVGEAKYVFEAKSIQRMELLVLRTLNWRLQVATPFSFIDYFLYKFSLGNSPDNLLMSSSVDLILSTIRGIDFLGFKPSEIAAAVALSALNVTQVLDTDNALACCIHVDKERVLRCHEVIQEMTLMKKKAHKQTSPSVSAVSKSPNGILDAACMSSETDGATVGSHAYWHASSPAAKKRKLNR